MNIIHLRHSEIDKKKWDEAIAISENGLVYALSWYLDIASPNWEALIVGDYEIVMPITHKKKYGINYLYQPIFIQQLGIFSNNKIGKDVVIYFVQRAQSKFKFIDIQLNCTNPNPNNESFVLRNTQLIDISKPYDELYLNYSKSIKKNLKKAIDGNLNIYGEGTSSDFINLMQKMFIAKKVDEIKKNDFERLKRIIDYSLLNGFGEIYVGFINQELCASAFFLNYGNRTILYSALNLKGREIGAMFGLIDKYIQQNAGKDLFFDFAGSNIPGVKYRNLGFGAKNEVYFQVKSNNLKFPFNLIKK